MASFSLHGQTALVTGASRGIGRAVARGLAEAGAHVIGVARSRDELARLGQDVTRQGREFMAQPVDLCHAAAVDEVAQAAWGWHGRVDILVNVAGTVVRKEVPTVSGEDWDRQFTLNVRVPFFLSQALGPRMTDAGGGSIVNITSVAGEVTTRAPSIYSASKAALIQLTKALAVRWAPLVRVNAVGPGYIRTAINDAWFDVPDNAQYVLRRTPLNRLATPDDVVGAVVFLASGAASYVTGHHLLVDGGWTAQ